MKDVQMVLWENQLLGIKSIAKYAWEAITRVTGLS